MADELGKLRAQVQELKREKSALENELQKSRNAASDAQKAKVAADEKAKAIPGLEEKIQAAEKENDRLRAENGSLQAQAERVEQFEADVEALKRLVS